MVQKKPKAVIVFIIIISSLLLLSLVLILAFAPWNDWIVSNKYLHPIIRTCLQTRKKKLVNWILNGYPELQLQGDRKKYVLDFGAGLCYISHELNTRGYDVYALDIKNLNVYPDIKLHLYDGQSLPYAELGIENRRHPQDVKFDFGVACYVFHHISKKDQPHILRQLQSICNEIILIEETPSREAWCRVINGEILSHARGHRTPEEWSRFGKVKKITSEDFLVRIQSTDKFSDSESS